MKSSIRLVIKDINIKHIVFSIEFSLAVHQYEESVEFTHIFTVNTNAFHFVSRFYDMILTIFIVLSTVYHKVYFRGFKPTFDTDKCKIHVSIITVKAFSRNFVLFFY